MKKYGDVITGFFVDTNTGKAMPVNGTIMQTTDMALLAKGGFHVISGKEAEPYIARISPPVQSTTMPVVPSKEMTKLEDYIGLGFAKYSTNDDSRVFIVLQGKSNFIAIDNSEYSVRTLSMEVVNCPTFDCVMEYYEKIKKTFKMSPSYIDPSRLSASGRWFIEPVPGIQKIWLYVADPYLSVYETYETPGFSDAIAKELGIEKLEVEKALVTSGTYFPTGRGLSKEFTRGGADIFAINVELPKKILKEYHLMTIADYNAIFNLHYPIAKMTKYQAAQQLRIVEKEMEGYIGKRYARFERRAKALLEVVSPGKTWETRLLEVELKQTEEKIKSERSRKIRASSFGGMRRSSSYERGEKKARIAELEKKRDNLMRQLGKEPPKKKQKKPVPGKYLYGTHRPIGLAGVPVKYIDDAILEGNPGIERSDIKHYLIEIENPTGNEVWTKYRISINYPIPENKIKEFEFHIIKE